MVSLKKKEEVTLDVEVATNAKPKPKKDALGRSYGTGRRKNAVARVWIKPGTGKISINYTEFEKYFARDTNCRLVLQPFEVTKTLGQFDVMCTVLGGGLSGQAGAIRHGLSRALSSIDEAFHALLHQAGLMTRDPRVVERKKYGQHKARKKTQFSKR